MPSTLVISNRRLMSNHRAPSLHKAFWVYGIGYLSLLYMGACLVVYAPLEFALGIPRHIGFVYFKVSFIIALCGYGTFKVVRLILIVGQQTTPNKDDKLTVEIAVGFIVFAAVVLFVVTAILAISSGLR